MAKSKNILLIGKGTIAVNCLEILEKVKILPKVIICDSGDSGKDDWAKSLYKRAKEMGFRENINLFRLTKVNDSDFIGKIKKFKIDIIFSIQPRAIFKKSFIALAKDYVVNLHMAPLPKLRGMSPCSWAILDNLKEMGVTLHLIEDEGIDNGPIIFQRKFPISDSDTAWSLFNKCVEYGTELFREKVIKIINNEFEKKEQNEKDVIYHKAGELNFADLEVNLNQKVEDASKFIRSRIFPPFQMPRVKYENKLIEILALGTNIVDNGSRRVLKKRRTSIKDDIISINFSDGSLNISKYIIEKR